MISDAFKDIEKLEKDLWAAADNLRANSKLTSSDYFMPVLGVIFLRHAANRFDAAHRQIETDQTSGAMVSADHERRTACRTRGFRTDRRVDARTGETGGLALQARGARG